MRSRAGRTAWGSALLVPTLALTSLAGCGGEAEQPPIDRETFVSTYVALRRAMVADTLEAGTRDSILAAHEVTADELRAWIEVQADDPEALAEVWREVLDSLTAAPDSLTADSAETETAVSGADSTAPDTVADGPGPAQ